MKIGRIGRDPNKKQSKENVMNIRQNSPRPDIIIYNAKTAFQTLQQ